MVGVTSSAGYSNRRFWLLGLQAGAAPVAGCSRRVVARMLPALGLAIGEQLLFNTGNGVRFGRSARAAELKACAGKSINSCQSSALKFQSEYDA